MAVKMSEVFKKMFPVKPEDIRTTPPEEREAILKALDRNLELAQEECERTLKPPSAKALHQEMTE